MLAIANVQIFRLTDRFRKSARFQLSKPLKPGRVERGFSQREGRRCGLAAAQDRPGAVLCENRIAGGNMRRVLAAGVIDHNVAGQKLSFEVASVKPSRSDLANSISTSGCRFLGRNVTFRVLLNFGYRPPNGQLRSNEVIGGPSWVDTDRFDVEATPEDTVSSLRESEMQAMVQSLLKDRFQLHTHRETRELPVYDLTIDKDGLKIKLSENQTQPQTAPEFCTKVTSNTAPSPPSQASEAARANREPLPRGVVKMTGASVTAGQLR